MENYKNILDDIINDIDPAEQRRTNQRMLLAAAIEDGMKAKGWKKKDLMDAVGVKNQSVITKWLSGTHNFTADTLFDIQHALGIDLIDLSNRKVETKKQFKASAQTKVFVIVNPYLNPFNNIDLQGNPVSYTKRLSGNLITTDC